MLSAQLLAMQFNVKAGSVNDGCLVYAAGATSMNLLGYATVNALMARVNTELGSRPILKNGTPYHS